MINVHISIHQNLEVTFYKMYIEDPQSARTMLLTPFRVKRDAFEKRFYVKALTVILNDLLDDDYSDKVIAIMSRFKY